VRRKSNTKDTLLQTLLKFPVLCEDPLMIDFQAPFSQVCYKEASVITRLA
jgi:hypothetical protein